jgi:hypothetical protein
MGKVLYEIKNETIFGIWLSYWAIYSPSILSYNYDEPTESKYDERYKKL